ncbi:MAG: HAD family hydrolase [Thermovirgaceae bacterium]
MTRRALIFDVDGVLVDTDRSFPNVVITAIQWWSRFRLGVRTDAQPFTREHYDITKNHGSFNDDYTIAWTFLSRVAALGKRRLSECRLTPGRWKQIISSCRSADPVPWVLETFGKEIPLQGFRDLCDEIYFGTGTLESARGRKPAFITMRGLWNLERSMLRVPWTCFGDPVGIYTGRTRAELSLALSLLGWTDFPCEACVTLDDGIAKPSPEGFRKLEKTLGCDEVLYFGDTESDRLAFEGYGKGRFIPVGPLFGKGAAENLPAALAREFPGLGHIL